jgi:DNA-binding NarL/FixJ family response regulator
MLAAGKTVGQIASELSLSSKTVSAHRAKIIEKMGVTTNAELIRYALEHNLM